MGAPAAENREATEAWSGPLFECFVQYRDLVAGGLGAHGEAALAAHPPRPGDRVVDLGCGFGDTTQRLAELVGPEGEALGVDVAEPFIELARKEADEAGAAQRRLRRRRRPGRRARRGLRLRLLADGADVLRQPGAGAAQRPQGARAGRHGSARSSGGASSTTIGSTAPSWSSTQYLEHPEETDQPTCGPGPFSMANADTVSEQLKIAGFEQIALQRCDLPLKIGDDLDHAVEFNMALGPAGEVLRLWEDRIDEIRPKIAAELREALADFEGPDGVFAPASTWIISAAHPLIAPSAVVCRPWPTPHRPSP